MRLAYTWDELGHPCIEQYHQKLELESVLKSQGIEIDSQDMKMFVKSGSPQCESIITTLDALGESRKHITSEIVKRSLLQEGKRSLRYEKTFDTNFHVMSSHDGPSQQRYSSVRLPFQRRCYREERFWDKYLEWKTEPGVTASAQRKRIKIYEKCIF